MKKHITIPIFIVSAFLWLMSSFVHATTTEISISPIADMTVSPDKTIGTSGSLYISNNNSNSITSETYKTYIFYDLTGIDKESLTAVNFEATCIQGAVGTKETLQLYGIPDLLDELAPETLTWQNAPCNLTTSSTSLTEDAAFLCDIAITQKNNTLTATSTELRNFIASDTNDILLLSITRKSLRNSRYSLASSDNNTYAPPTLKLNCDMQLKGFADIRNKVLALPEETSAEQTKKAALTWAIDDTAQALMDGLFSQAQEQLNDITEMLPADIGKDSGNRLFPEMLVTDRNPYLSGLESNVVNYLKKEKIYRKSFNWGIEEFPQPKTLRSEFEKKLDITSFLLTQQQGTYSGSPELLKETLKYLEALCYYHTNGDLNTGRTSSDANMNRFVYASYNIAFLQITTAYPDILPASVKERWLKTVEETAEYQIKTFGSIYNKKNPHGAGYYANMDCCYTALMEAAGILLGNDNYRASASSRSSRIEEYMCADGAWPYLGYANEVPTYHQTNIHYLTYYYMMSKNPQTLEMLKKSEPYYPITIEKNSLIEFSTVPFFKQYWEQVEPGYLEVIATLAQSGQNRYLAQCILDSSENAGSIFGTLFYNPDISPVQVEQNRMIYDRNIMGVRGHFDEFSYCFNGRDWKDDRGKPTLVGAAAIGDGTYPSEGFLQNAYGAVYDTIDHAYHIIQENAAPDPFDMEERHAPTNSYALCENEEVSAFGSVYHLQKPQAGGGRSSITPFGGMQEWIFFPDRIIGLVETTINESATAFGTEGVLQFGEGRGNSSQDFTIEQTGDNIYTYGSLQAIVHDQNYGSVNIGAPNYTEILQYGPIQYLKFNDTDLTQSKTYIKNHKNYYIVEVGLKGQTPLNVNRISTTETDCLTINKDGEIWYLFHNTSDASQSIEIPVDMYSVRESTLTTLDKDTSEELQPYEIMLCKKIEEPLEFLYGEETASEPVSGKLLTLRKNIDCPGSVFMAIYHNGVLVSVNFSSDNEVSSLLPKNISDISVKGFLWENTESQFAITKAIQLP